LYITTHVNNYQYRIQAEKRVKELHVEIDQLEVEQDRLMNRIAELSTKPLENRKKIEEAWIDAQIKRDDIKSPKGAAIVTNWGWRASTPINTIAMRN